MQDNIIKIDCGDDVLCDWCNDDHTEHSEEGGAIFMSSGDAVCPKCYREWRKKNDPNEKRIHVLENHAFIPFRDFVLAIRKKYQSNEITVTA